MGWFKKAWKGVTSVGSLVVSPIGYASKVGYDVADQVGASLGMHTPSVKKANKASDAANANAAAAERQAEYEEQAAKGLERMRLRRKRGFGSTVLTGGPETLGAPGSGSALLGQ